MGVPSFRDSERNTYPAWQVPMLPGTSSPWVGRLHEVQKPTPGNEGEGGLGFLLAVCSDIPNNRIYMVVFTRGGGGGGGKTPNIRGSHFFTVFVE